MNDGSPISRSLQRADELHAAFKPKEALAELLRVLESDSQNVEAMSKIARVYIDLGDTIPESTPDWEAERLKQYRVAEQYARKAVKADPDGTWGHFYVAASLGSVATVSPVAKQIDLAGEIRGAVEKAITLDPQNDFAYPVYGVCYVAVENWWLARNLLTSIRELPIQFSDDAKLKRKAEQILAEIKEH